MINTLTEKKKFKRKLEIEKFPQKWKKDHTLKGPLTSYGQHWKLAVSEQCFKILSCFLLVLLPAEECGSMYPLADF